LRVDTHEPPFISSEEYLFYRIDRAVDYAADYRVLLRPWRKGCRSGTLELSVGLGHFQLLVFVFALTAREKLQSAFVGHDQITEAVENLQQQFNTHKCEHKDARLKGFTKTDRVN